MKIKLIKLLCLFTLTWMISSCSKEDTIINVEQVPGEIPAVTPENFEEAITGIGDWMEDFTENHDIETISDFEHYLPQIEQQEWVENASLDTNNNVLCIKVKDGGLMLWYTPQLVDEEETRSSGNDFSKNLAAINDHITATRAQISQTKTDPRVVRPNLKMPRQIITNSNTSSDDDLIYGCENRKVLIANATHGDSKYLRTAQKLDTLAMSLQNYFGVFDVDYRKGYGVTPNLLQNHLTEYGLIILVAHGMPTPYGTYIQTGGTVGDNDYEDSEIYQAWKSFHYAAVTPYPRSENDNPHKQKWAISPNFFNIIDGTFDDYSIMVAGICGTLSGSNPMADNLLSKNLGAFIGFDDQCHMRMIEDAIGVILNMFPSGAESSKNISLFESFESVDQSPYKFNSHSGPVTSHMMVKTMKSDIGLFSTISEAKEVNLGLPWNWASCNLGANNPWEYGDYLNVGCDSNNPRTMWDGPFCGVEGCDPVRSVMGEDWQLPDVLDRGYISPNFGLTKVYRKFRYHDILGVRVTGPSGESIFIPYGGSYEGGIAHNPAICFNKEHSFQLPLGYSKARWNDNSTYKVEMYFLYGDYFENIRGYVFNASCGKTSDGEIPFDFHSNKFTIRGVRPNPYYDSSTRLEAPHDLDLDYQSWKSSFK